jgi:ATP-dependent RNA helicase RhlE
MSFTKFNLDPSIMAGVEALGYSVPTPIQDKSIPPIMEGSDLIGLAQTGTGKTAAFALPVLHRLHQGVRNRVRAVILSPTRELAEQTSVVINDLGRKASLHSIPIYGGVGMDQQVRGLRRGNEIVVACPGRLLDHIWKGSINLSNVEILIIDEADRMFDMGFINDIRNIMKCMPTRKQTLLFSATMPDDIRRLVQEILTNPVIVQIGHSQPATTVRHTLYPVKQNLKISLLIEVLRKMETDSVLVFTRTKYRAERVTDQLKKAGFRAASLQGNLSQNRRQAALDGFRNGSFKILVATDIAARGIDVLSISHVINFDMPENNDAYIHRIGRTGRIEKNGDALSLITGEDTGKVRDLERSLKMTLKRQIVEGFDYNKSVPVRMNRDTHFPQQFNRKTISNVRMARVRSDEQRCLS